MQQNKELLNTILNRSDFLANEYTYDASLNNYCWFKVGGNADVLIHTKSLPKVQKLLYLAHQAEIPCFILGDGSNIVISDHGIEGFVIDTKYLANEKNITITSHSDNVQHIHVPAGLLMEKIVLFSIKHQLEGLTNFYGLPGTLGGALFMNARCYDKEIADFIVEVTALNHHGERIRIPYQPKEWQYKVSPFQKLNLLIIQAILKLSPSIHSAKDLLILANQFKQDRVNKGHFSYPCAGSTFKNNRHFGKPSGKIIDECQLKTLSYGGAALSEHHANIIVNKGNATASDIYTLVHIIQERVFTQTGFKLEPEILFIGRGYT